MAVLQSGMDGSARHRDTGHRERPGGLRCEWQVGN